MLCAEIQVFRANEAGYHKSGIEVSGKILATIFLKLGASQDDKGILPVSMLPEAARNLS